MAMSTFDVTVRIIIHSHEISETISAIMGVPQTIRYNTPRFPNDKTWSYSVVYKNQTDIDECIGCFLSAIPGLPSKIAKVQALGDCAIRVSVVSEYGQFGYGLSPETLRLLAQLNIPFETTVFSFGSCVDE